MFILDDFTKVKIKNAFQHSECLLQKFNSIGNAIAAYNLKFDQNASDSSIPGKSIAKELSGNLMGIPIGSLVSGVGAGSLGCLKATFPPSLISKLTTELGFKLIEISMQSKGYGVINRHGITGQLRSHLLKNYIEMISVFIKNHYHYIFSQNTENAIKSSSDVIMATSESFNESYNDAIKLLPNQNQNGSLYYYLDMYVKGDNNKINKWNKSKLGSIYK